VTTCIENLEISVNFKDVNKKSWKMGKVREIVLEKIIVAIL